MTPSKYGQILMMPDEIDFMEEVVRSIPDQGMMVEWGSGGSTCKWLETMNATQTLVSIEHDRTWHSIVSANVSKHFDAPMPTFRYLHVNDLVANEFDRKIGTGAEELPVGTHKYVFPCDDLFDADVFFIDGIARGPCLAATLLNKKPSARVFVHDYAKRTFWYNWITQFTTVEMVGTTLAEIRV